MTMARKNIKVPESLFLALRDDKPDNVTWPAYLEARCLNDERETNVSLNADDVKNACVAALREELPEGALR